MIQLIPGGNVQTKKPNKTDTLCHKIQFQVYYLPKEMHGSKGLTLFKCNLSFISHSWLQMKAELF